MPTWSPQEVRLSLLHQLGKSQYKHLQRHMYQPSLDMVVVDQRLVVELEEQVAVQTVALVVLRVEDRHQCNRESQRSHLR